MSSESRRVETRPIPPAHSDPYKGLQPNWWQQGNSLEQNVEPIKLLPARSLEEQRDDPLVGYFNPTCKHDRCAFTILNCDACIAYTKNYFKLKIGARDAEPTQTVDRTKAEPERMVLVPPEQAHPGQLCLPHPTVHSEEEGAKHRGSAPKAKRTMDRKVRRSRRTRRSTRR